MTPVLDKRARPPHHRRMVQRLRPAEAVLGSPIRNVAFVLAFVVAVTVAATIAYMAAGWSFGDALYMVVLTIYTVGFREVRPIDGEYLRGVTITTMVLGCTGMILLTSALVQFFTVVQIRALLGGDRMQNRIARLSGHVIVCGYGRIGRLLARDLTAAGVPLVIVDRNADKLAEAEPAGFPVLAGDATAEETLRAAGIDRARVLATVLPDDAANVFITLSARNLNRGIEIIARGEVPSTETKLRHAGADHVVMPTHIGAERIARMVLFPQSNDMREGAMARQLDRVGLALERVAVEPGSALAGLAIAAAERRAAGACLILEVERDGSERISGTTGGERLQEGDRVLLLVREAAAARDLFAARKERGRAGRRV